MELVSLPSAPEWSFSCLVGRAEKKSLVRKKFKF